LAARVVKVGQVELEALVETEDRPAVAAMAPVVLVPKAVQETGESGETAEALGMVVKAESVEREATVVMVPT
jgi:hypothetical protein